VHIRTTSAPAARRVADRHAAELTRLLEPGAIRAVYQPIVRLDDWVPVGYEGLARFPSPPGLIALPPDVTLAAAQPAGLRHDLEVACWAAIAQAGPPPEGRLLFVNVDPDALGHPGLWALADRLPYRLVIELTEQDAVRDCGVLRERLAPWLARGAMVAVDDAGAGFTSLEYVAELRPDFLKLSRTLVMGVDRDLARRSVLRATVAFAREVGARVVAEGVEFEEELAVLRAAEVHYGQGWLFGRPSAVYPDVLAPPGAPAPPPLLAPAESRRGRLQRELARVPDAKGACQAVVDHLSRTGVIPSAYLEQGGRLRCQAVSGAWQVCDGLPLDAGTIGEAFRTGTTVLVADVARTAGRVPSVASVSAVACAPVRVGGRVAGVLCAESPTPLGRAATSELERCAALLGERLGGDLAGGELPGACAGSPAQRFARIALRLAALEEPSAIVAEALAAARELSGFESGLLALHDAGGYERHAAGPFGVLLNGLAIDELDRMGAWVAPGSSCHTMGDRSGRGLPGHEPLRRAGAAALVVLPLTAGGERLGLLVLADREARALPTEEVEVLELLATLTATGLRMRPRWSSCASAPPATRSPASATTARSTPSCPHCARARGRRTPWRSWSPMSTGSRRSMTAAATPPATRCCAASPSCSASRRWPPRPRRARSASAATSSRSPTRRRDPRRRARSATSFRPGCAPAWARRCRSGSRWPSPARATRSSPPAPTRRSTP
jgi:EAL domain-containing protein (putative c-di-GMP-specific phosphodiesterase class I)/putative methionine-R-sulfoxide reductase with GAF domain